MEPHRPFRWDLVRPDALGSLLDGVAEPDLWYLDELVDCAAKVRERAGDADLYFVGRSVDSLFDLLSGALQGSARADRLHQLPLSLYQHDGARLTAPEEAQLRTNLASEGLSPDRLQRGRATAFVDLVHEGSTFGNLYAVLRAWVDDERAQWDVIRRRLRFVGITRRTSTSPKTWRWQQHAPWVAELPASAVANVSLDPRVWGWLGNEQSKTAPSFRRTRWSQPDAAGPQRDDRTRSALAEAVALVEAGRGTDVRRTLRR